MAATVGRVETVPTVAMAPLVWLVILVATAVRLARAGLHVPAPTAAAITNRQIPGPLEPVEPISVLRVETQLAGWVAEVAVETMARVRRVTTHRVARRVGRKSTARPWAIPEQAEALAARAQTGEQVRLGAP